MAFRSRLTPQHERPVVVLPLAPFRRDIARRRTRWAEEKVLRCGFPGAVCGRGAGRLRPEPGALLNHGEAARVRPPRHEHDPFPEGIDDQQDQEDTSRAPGPHIPTPLLREPRLHHAISQGGRHGATAPDHPGGTPRLYSPAAPAR